MAATDILGKIGEKVGGEIKTLENYVNDTFATKAALQLLQNEVDASQVGAGLGVDGSYTADATSNYLTAATSLKDADGRLDAQIKLNTSGITANAGAIDVIEASAGLSADGAYIPETNSNYIDTASSLAEASSLLDTQVGVVSESVATNAQAISELEASKYDKTGGTISGNVVVTGDLQVQGTTTTINSTVVEVADNVIEVNLASDGAATAAEGGLNVNRGAEQAKAGLVWDNSESYWKVQLGTALANLRADVVTASLVGNVTGNVTGDVTGNLTGNVTGNVTGNLTGSVTAPSNGISINGVILGDFASFESAFDTAVA